MSFSKKSDDSSRLKFTDYLINVDYKIFFLLLILTGALYFLTINSSTLLMKLTGSSIFAAKFQKGFSFFLLGFALTLSFIKFFNFFKKTFKVKMSKPTSKLVLTVSLLVMFAVLSLLFSLGSESAGSPDELHMINIAENLNEGNGYVSNRIFPAFSLVKDFYPAHTWRPLLIPYLLKHTSYGFVKFINLIAAFSFFVVIFLILFWESKDLFFSFLLSLIAFFSWTLTKVLTRGILTEPLYLFFTFFSLYFILIRFPVLGAVFLGLAYYVRFQVLYLVAPFFFMLIYWKMKSFKKLLLCALVFILVCSLQLYVFYGVGSEGVDNYSHAKYMIPSNYVSNQATYFSLLDAPETLSSFFNKNPSKFITVFSKHFFAGLFFLFVNISPFLIILIIDLFILGLFDIKDYIIISLGFAYVFFFALSWPLERYIVLSVPLFYVVLTKLSHIRKNVNIKIVLVAILLANIVLFSVLCSAHIPVRNAILQKNILERQAIFEYVDLHVPAEENIAINGAGTFLTVNSSRTIVGFPYYANLNELKKYLTFHEVSEIIITKKSKRKYGDKINYVTPDVPFLELKANFTDFEVYSFSDDQPE